MCSVYDLAGAGHDRDRAAELGIREGGAGGSRGVEVVGDDDVRQDAEHARPAPTTTSRAGTMPASSGNAGLDACGVRDRDVDDTEIAVADGAGDGEGVVARLDQHALGERARVPRRSPPRSPASP